MTEQPFRLAPPDAPRYARFRLRMLTEAPWAFAASPDDPADAGLDLAFIETNLRAAENAILAMDQIALAPETAMRLAAGEPPALVAAAGIVRGRRRKFRHRARLWGLFVAPEARRRGFGRDVVNAAVQLARTWQGVDFVDLGVSENSPDALRLYQSLGFQQWGREPEATDLGGSRFDELHMTLRL